MKLKLKFNLQKIVYSSVFVMGIVFFAYSLIFSTDIYPLANMADPESAVTYVPGAEVYAITQPFNKLLLGLSVVMIIVSLSPLIFFSSTRRLFYASNYISSIVFVAYSVFMAVITVIHVLYFRSQYLLVDFERYKEVALLSNERYVKSTFYFDLGMVISVLALAVSAMVVYVCVKKIKLKRLEANVASSAEEVKHD